MPKVSSAAKDAIEVSLGIQEGTIEVIGAIVKVHQYPPSKATGQQGDPFPCVQLKVARLDDKGARLDEDPITEEFGIGKLEKFHPGKADSATDNDPEDVGNELDAEGNCIYAVDDSAKLNKRCKWVLFTASLEAKGFKSEVLANGFMPDLVGLKCHVHSEVQPRFPGSTATKDPTALVVDKVLQFPYEKKGKAAPAAAPVKAAAKAAPAAAATAPAPAAPAASSNGSGDAESIALTTLADVATEMAGKSDVERKKLQTAFQTKLMRKGIPVKLHKPALDLVKDDEWLTRITTEDDTSPVYGRMMLDGDTVSFAEAE